MSIRTGKLTVFFEEPFWVGIFERVENGKLSVSKVTFGTEPKDYEIWEFVLKEYDRLQFSPSVEVTAKELTKNPKKLQREIHKQMLDRGVGTKSQQALKLQQEQRKQQRNTEGCGSGCEVAQPVSGKRKSVCAVSAWNAISQGGRVFSSSGSGNEMASTGSGAEK